MQQFLIPEWLVWLSLAVLILFGAAATFLTLLIHKSKKDDYILMLDGEKSFRVIRTKIKERMKYEDGAKFYPLLRDAMRVSDKGRKLFIFEANKPNALKIEGNKEKWITAEALKEVINNEIIKLMLKVSDKKEILILIAMAASCIGAFCSMLVAAKIFGLIKG